jgi:DNA-binding CsgD family transcriptional regulator
LLVEAEERHVRGRQQRIPQELEAGVVLGDIVLSSGEEAALLAVVRAGRPGRSHTAGERNGQCRADAARPLPDLTPQELHIANLVAEGKTNKEIAVMLFLSPKTIQYHLANTFRKLDIHSRAELSRIVTLDARVEP